MNVIYCICLLFFTPHAVLDYKLTTTRESMISEDYGVHGKNASMWVGWYMVQNADGEPRHIRAAGSGVHGSMARWKR